MPTQPSNQTPGARANTGGNLGVKTLDHRVDAAISELRLVRLLAVDTPPGTACAP